MCIRDSTITRAWVTDEKKVVRTLTESKKYRSPRAPRTACTADRGSYDRTGFLKAIRLQGSSLSPLKIGKTTQTDLQQYSSPPALDSNTRNFTPVMGQLVQNVSEMEKQLPKLPFLSFRPQLRPVEPASPRPVIVRPRTKS
eukprot:TRINITY_DN20231_c0_g1_i1.p1 TRINITY_DN20231_c0_g1~~TRINITY_DN20231_c0_g1_i1.p1  ORF type:complete len:141 (-),score=27.91 TRINITY_DN20231_c0_g1_i1:264-686(-)